MSITIQRVDLALERKQALVNLVTSHQNFDSLVTQVANFQKDVSIKETEAFQIIFAEGKEKLEVVFVKLNTEAILQAMIIDNELDFKVHYTAEFNGRKTIRISIIEDEKVVLESEIPYKKDHFLFVDELKQPEYTNAIDKGELQEKAWYEGCLRATKDGKTYYYKNCGAGCTSSSSINGLDSCCQAHDRCYANFGKGNNSCDYSLYNCAMSSTDAGWWAVSEFAWACYKGKLGSIC